MEPSLLTTLLFFGGGLLFFIIVFTIVIIKNKKASVKFEINSESIKNGKIPENFEQQAIKEFDKQDVKKIELNEALLKINRDNMIVDFIGWQTTLKRHFRIFLKNIEEDSFIGGAEVALKTNKIVPTEWEDWYGFFVAQIGNQVIKATWTDNQLKIFNLDGEIIGKINLGNIITLEGKNKRKILAKQEGIGLQILGRFNSNPVGGKFKYVLRENNKKIAELDLMPEIGSKKINPIITLQTKLDNNSLLLLSGLMFLSISFLSKNWEMQTEGLK